MSPPRRERLDPEPLRVLLADMDRRRLVVGTVASGTAIREALEVGPTVHLADRIAIACGHHPAELWMDW